jgi:hypothetical protein
MDILDDILEEIWLIEICWKCSAAHIVCRKKMGCWSIIKKAG